MTMRRPLSLACTTVALALLSGTAPSVLAQPAPTAPAPQGGAIAWQDLSPAQRAVLQPLASQWATLPAGSQEKWVQVAARYPKLSATEQQRLRERMIQWASLPASERGEARLRFQQARQLSPTERQQKWEAYQALSPQDRDLLGGLAAQRDAGVGAAHLETEREARDAALAALASRGESPPAGPLAARLKAAATLTLVGKPRAPSRGLTFQKCAASGQLQPRTQLAAVRRLQPPFFPAPDCIGPRIRKRNAPRRQGRPPRRGLDRPRGGDVASNIGAPEIKKRMTLLTF